MTHILHKKVRAFCHVWCESGMTPTQIFAGLLHHPAVTDTPNGFISTIAIIVVLI
jgi:hypothetical protein